MGHIEIHDGLMNHRTRVEGFVGTIRIELTEPDEPTITIPSSITLNRAETNDPEPDDR